MASVTLNTEHRKLKNGERAEYWYLRWYGLDGRRRAKCIGRTDELSKTKAHRIRLRKMADLEMHPGPGNHLQVIAEKQWAPKSRRSRWVPVCPELRKILKGPRADWLGPLTEAKLKSYPAILDKAKVKPYDKPFHSLRKSCAQDWAARNTLHVVREGIKCWASGGTADAGDLKSPEVIPRAGSNPASPMVSSFAARFVRTACNRPGWPACFT